jgi:probable addiction module antidote protein
MPVRRHQARQNDFRFVEETQMTKTAPYDSAEFLNSPKAIKFYMEEAMESGDPRLIAHALGVVARANSMSEIARKSGLTREGLYKSLSPNGRPELATVMRVLNALGIGLSLKVLKVTASAKTAKSNGKSKKKNIKISV